jgi:hypothetical protein
MEAGWAHGAVFGATAGPEGLAGQVARRQEAEAAPVPLTPR